MSQRSHIPRATYRLQLNRSFTFEQATAIVPYLSDLGISHCYISPCLRARPGSTHGYDIVDHNSFNPEIGSAEDFNRFVSALHERGMGLILDLVPNHMGVMGSDNTWWLDVLENGEASTYASFFDIDWRPLKDELWGKVLVPILHDHYGAVLESGELKLTLESSQGEFSIDYRGHRLPIDPSEYPRILRRCETTLVGTLGAQNVDVLDFQSLITALGHLPGRQEASSDRLAERNRDKEIHKRRMAELCTRSPEIAASIKQALEQINGNPGDSASFEYLHELIKAQAFRLANWRVASDDINYRRFFDTNDLAGIRMENDSVFAETHRLVLHLLAQGQVDGLRIDHPDGLYDPARYFEQLKRAIAAPAADSSPGKGLQSSSCRPYIVIEKILTGTEQLPADWAVCGTTGYDFANLVNGLFLPQTAVKLLDRIYRSFISDEIDVEELTYRSRKLITRIALASELNVLANQITRIALSKRRTCDFTLNSLRDALTEVVANFPVYRTYISAAGVSPNDAAHIQQAIDAAKSKSPAADTSIFGFVRDVLLTRIADGQDPAYQKSVTTFAMRFQQFSSPVMAKGVEDTAFYQYNRLVSLNDVGGDLRKFGTTIVAFHRANQERLARWPHTMLATSTHDSKRSEDVRARINVLSELTGFWRLRVRDWSRFNRNHKRLVNEVPAPSANDEYLFYQTLVGVWPVESLSGPYDKVSWKSVLDRMEAYMLKAVREAKQNTSWINRNAEYEDAVSGFVRALLTPGPKNRFLNDFVPFQRKVARLGLWNSLSQTILKLTCPGVPDIYQGNELWKFDLVDPDNRRPVDYSCPRAWLRNMGNEAIHPPLIKDLLDTPEDGRLKLYSIAQTLRFRSQHPDLFQNGEYMPVATLGWRAEHIVAFARRWGKTTILVAVPRLVATLLDDTDIDLAPIGTSIWGDTHLRVPACNGFAGYRNMLTGEAGTMTSEGDFAEIDAARVFASFPVAICLFE